MRARRSALDIARCGLAAAAANLGVDTISWKDDAGNGTASYISGKGGDVNAVYTAALADATDRLGETGEPAPAEERNLRLKKRCRRRNARTSDTKILSTRR
jgi:hypothetical protein